MDKKRIIVAIIIIVIIIQFMYLLKINNKYKERIVELEDITAGMAITMLGGSNMKENGNTNSCGYVIRTANEELILVDGGLESDANTVLEYINRFGNGTVDYWFITHPHVDHVGALITLLEKENIQINNLYYYFNSLEYYEKYDERGFPTEQRMFEALESSKIKNKIECQKGQIIELDNIDCEIIRVANESITDSDNGNESSMVFKLIAKDVDKSIIFLGDAFFRVSEELMQNPEILKADAVQMAHHGQNGVTKEVYQAIDPEVCFFNAPEWLYNNDNGTGYNTGTWKSIIVREWLQEMDTKNIVAYDGDRTIRFTHNGIEY